ncbi:MAG: mandelate racemase/muconate lactonizing enzyme family protein, partial [Chloroflexi bacterium]|nr:mandelate racemase/muconate lactonizing enzyme family protein [Chloroflexota bacterium]
MAGNRGLIVPYDLNFAIKEIETFHLAFPMRYWEEFRKDEVAKNERFEFTPGWQTVYAASIETAMVHVRFADGSEGWGEVNTPIGPEVVCLIWTNIVLPIVKGREFASPTALWGFLYDAQRGRGYSAGYWLDALAGVDIAVWDALGKRNGVPVAALLSGSPRKRIPVYLSGIRKATRKERVKEANRWFDDGLRGVKIFLKPDVDAGLEELDALRAGCPRMKHWMVDFLWMLDAESAEMAKNAFGVRSVEFLECPLQPEDIDGHRELVRKAGAPIALGEHFRTLYQARGWFDPPRALDVYQPDIGRTGLSDGLRQLEAASTAGLSVTPHMGNGMAVFQGATLQFSAVCKPSHLQEFQYGHYRVSKEIADSGWVYRNGAFDLPDRPGLGVKVDEASLE